MARYLISFNDGAMTFPEGELGEVGDAAHAVVEEAKDAGTWVFGGGLYSYTKASFVGTDGSILDGPNPESRDFIGGFSIIDVATHDDALAWAAKFAVACRCGQEVREIMFDPSTGPFPSPTSA